jgi:hypothetical protein
MRQPALTLLVILATLSAWSSPARYQAAPKPSAKIARVVNGDAIGLLMGCIEEGREGTPPLVVGRH